MAQQTINVGAAPNDGTGTPLRTAFQYTNSNFTELYTAVGPSGNNIVVPGNATITGAANFNGGALAAYLNGSLLVGSSGNYVNIYGQSNGLIVKDSTGVQNLFSIATAGVFTFGDGAGGTRMTLNSTGLGVGVASPATKLDVAGNARVQLAFFTGGSIPGLTNDNPFAYRFPGGGLGLGAATETGTASPIIFYTGQGGVERVRVKGFGQVRFFPLAADPSGAEAGDVYYNSTSNKLKCYNGTTWNDLF